MARFWNHREGAGGLGMTRYFTSQFLRRHLRSSCREKRIGLAIVGRRSVRCCVHSRLRRGAACRARHFRGTLLMNREDRQECLSRRVIFLRAMPIRKTNKKKRPAAKKTRARKPARSAKGATAAKIAPARGTDPK